MRRLLPGLMLTLLVGCGVPKLNEERNSFDVDINGKTFDLPAVRAEQKISVTASATGGPIDVYVFLTKNKAAVEKDIMAKRLTSVLASEEGKESFSLQATIPPNEEASIWLKAATLKKTIASVKFKN